MADGQAGEKTESGGWTREKAELVRRTVCPKGISADEFDLFMEQCKRSGLDPLIKEAFCVARRQNVGNREKPNWVTKYEFQPSEAGMLARAERFPDFRGLQASAVFAEDEIIVDQGKGEVTHRFNPAKRKGALVGAWARVVRDGKLAVVVWLDFSGYVQQTPLWSKIPTTMIEKCARVAALRKSYPEAFGGLYVREEMPAEEYGPGEEPVGGPYEERGARVQHAPTAASLGATALPSAQGVSPPEERTAVGEPEAATSHSAKEESTLAKAKAGTNVVVVAFGPYKGKTAAELSDAELSGTVDLATEKLQEEPKARWAKAMRENLAALEAEVERRCRVPQSPASAREPGMDDGDDAPYPAKD